MEIVLDEGFVDELLFCPKDFQQDFRKIYQQLKIVDNPLEIRGIRKYKTGRYKIYLWKSRISMKVKGQQVYIGMFLYNEFYRLD
ncbi:MAG: hypothetical protein QM802_23155 [Agriterribacter sp.]